MLLGYTRRKTGKSQIYLLRVCTRTILFSVLACKTDSFRPPSSCTSHCTLYSVNGNIDDEVQKVNSRSADYPPYVSEVVEDDNEELRRMPLYVRDEGGGAKSIYSAQDDRCVPVANPWWFGLLDGYTLELGPFKIISKSARETRIRKERSYARQPPFNNKNSTLPPTLCDLSTPQMNPRESFWISLPARLISYATAYVMFPFITRFVDTFVTMPSSQLDEITSKFGPGISILYGTFISLTLSILYNRQKTIQEVASVEAAQLALMGQNLLSLFRTNEERATRAAQCVADQIRILVSSSRGEELLILMYSDPYARMRELIDDYELDNNGQAPSSLSANCRDLVKDLFRSRATRLSDESLALPPTHFLILNILTIFMLLSFTLNTIPTIDLDSSPSNESCLLFATLSTIYILFYNFASDLNLPFQGVYQVRRSTASAHLLQLKWVLANHPLLRGKVDFEKPADYDEMDSVRIESPGLGELWFNKS